MIGVLVNTGAILLGGLIGQFVKKGLPERLADIIMKAVALSVVYIAVTGLLEGNNALVVIVSMIVGTVIGQLLGLDDRLTRLGDRLAAKAKASGGSFTEGFVSSTLLFCVGAMAVTGSLKAGISGDNSVLFSKALLDGISALIFASSLGWGVMCSSVMVFVYQGLIVLLAGLIAPYLGQEAVSEMTAVGSLLILAIGLNMLGVTKIKVMNMLPAIFLPIGLVLFM